MTPLSSKHSSTASEKSSTASTGRNTSSSIARSNAAKDLKLWDIMRMYSEAPPTAGIIWALPKTSIYPVVDVLELSLRERKRLCAGPRVEVFEGNSHVATVPLHLMLSVSSKTRDMYHQKPDLAEIHLPQGIEAAPIKHIVSWLDSTGRLAKCPNLPEGQTPKQDLMICRAAMALGLERHYYENIFGLYWTRFATLRGCQLNREIYQNIADVEALALDENDVFFACVVKRLAELRRAGDMGDKAVWVKLFCAPLEVGRCNAEDGWRCGQAQEHVLRGTNE
ncbi:uncharacterized protein EI97DRAFT_501982 [Westerdykella ornata]|uniref:Uncharacterized protein n=1 Tax=Westerdykella ornata TaxID=318751 RepID=A0A6A6JFK1_WESOR|nr:uncharacterized protein EI97DRAFT_501982 [Westerdykella ornata]KAF2275400.1 hypothetical protein EI97DRAFT_501982 [Westerdykella ornata]